MELVSQGLLGILTTLSAGGIALYHLGPYGLGVLSSRIIRRGNPASRMVALTFDDGPDPRYTPRCLEILSTYGIRACFFLVGERVRRYPVLAREIRAQGHEVGNHTWSHRSQWFLSPRRTKLEVREGAEAISEVLGERPCFFRPPHGRMNLIGYQEATALGERCVLWSLSAQDWRRGRSPAWITKRVMARLQGGDIVLLHDGGEVEGAPEAMLGALPEIIRGARQRGFDLVPLREMMVGKGNRRQLRNARPGEKE